MKNKKGFTLIEILTVIAILAIILLISVPVVLKNIEKAKQKSYENQVSFFLKSAEKYVTIDGNISWESTDVEGKKQLILTLQDMVNIGYFSLPIINPITNETFDPDATRIIVYKQDGKYTYEYEDLEHPNLNNRAPGLYQSGTTTLAKVTLDGNEVNATWENIKKAYPEAFTTAGSIVANGTSSYLTSLVGDLIIGSDITTIGSYAFYGCTSLTSVTIPNSVTTIGDRAFSGVPHITYSGSATGTPWGALSIN